MSPIARHLYGPAAGGAAGVVAPAAATRDFDDVFEDDGPNGTPHLDDADDLRVPRDSTHDDAVRNWRMR